jgi:hypothetical protein
MWPLIHFGVLPTLFGVECYSDFQRRPVSRVQSRVYLLRTQPARKSAHSDRLFERTMSCFGLKEATSRAFLRISRTSVTVRLLVVFSRTVPGSAERAGHARRVGGVTWRSGRAPLEPMMEAANRWDRHDATIAGLGNRTRNRRVFCRATKCVRDRS